MFDLPKAREKGKKVKSRKNEIKIFDSLQKKICFETFCI
jgi:hypothetical protein